MIRLGIFGALMLLWVLFELAGRKKRNLQPQSLPQLLRYAQKKTSPSRQYPPFLFALLTLLTFSFWEAFLRALLDAQGPSLLPLVGVLCLAVFFYRRARLWNFTVQNEIFFTQLDLLLLLLGSAAFLPALSPLLLSPWIYLRSRHLKMS